ncbi:hypothetical protein AHA02nite_20110 [Alkalibacillus haloalkaliphilus]|uniref:Uncharacterized protein n=1 Tax=Alkalibacillus haloalkaliphilus TaxID=94136 RepID=A0A511W577_9BACI|nr:hypothetical protein AHA02nite_20110 [Alkalibacillus haloalkaliphilus]
MEMDRCFCYEKFKDQLPKDFKPKCFKEQCRNYRENMKKLGYNVEKPK